MTDEAALIAPGTQLGEYRIVKKLGEGGMGVVYVGEHLELGHQVAIKLLLPELSRNQEVVQRFINEAKAATRIKNPGIVQILGFGRHQGSAYFSMELLDGQSLAARLRERRVLVPEQVATIGRQIANTLAAAHAQGIVHRDLKPDNVMLVPDAEVASGERTKILDFGIAKLATDDQASVKTRTGMPMGTPAYMSPEQCRGAGEVDLRTDVYALGCILFEMLCGRAPFVGTGVGEILGYHQYVAPPAPRSLSPTMPAGLESLVLRCLAKTPEERPSSMAEVAKALEPFVRQVSGNLAVPIGPEAATLRPGTRPSSLRVPELTTAGAAAGQVEDAAGAGAAPRSRLPWLILAGVVVAGIAGTSIFLATRRKHEDGPRAAVAAGAPAASDTPSPSAPAASAPLVVPAAAPAEPPPLATADLNPLIRIEPPTPGLTLGLPGDLASSDEAGFRPAAHVEAPSAAYELQQHEVTWQEFDGWDARDAVAQQHGFTLPPTRPARMPVTGAPWGLASAYCQARFPGGHLPSEAEWEYAARGAGLRALPWDAAGDTSVTAAQLGPIHAFQGDGATPREVMAGTRDRTPGPAALALHDLLGNVREWTADEWRDDSGQTPPWIHDAGRNHFAVRGLPLAKPAPTPLPRFATTYRKALCGAGPCKDDAKLLLATVGFRCARTLP